MLNLTLAQGFASIPDPDPLPPAPFFARWFLETPIPTVIVFAIVAMIGWWWFQRSANAKAAWITAAACIVAAGLTYLLATLVVTEREKLQARAADLVQATVATNPAAVGPLLREDVSVVLLGADQPRITRDAILQRLVDDRVTRGYVQTARLQWVTATLDGPNVARTQCKIFANTPLGDGTSTIWMIHWARRDENSPWQVRMIDGQMIGPLPAKSLNNY
ncbi:MAG: hypothetical protein QM783_18550 [Phycisphaerales bacterium]